MLNLPPDSSEAAKMRREFALLPKLHTELWDRYDGKIPADSVIRAYLVTQREPFPFNKKYVDDFIAQFRSTVAYAGLTAADKIDGEGNGDNGDTDEDSMESTLEKHKGNPPPLNPPPPSKGLRDFPLYTSGQKGGLYVPERMSKKDYQLLKTQIDNSLAVILATAVEDEQKVQ